MAEAFMQRYGQSSNGMRIAYSREKTPMRTGGAIKYAEELIGHEEPFLVLNGDIFTKIDYTTLLKRHNEYGAVATIALIQVEDPSRYGTVKLTKDSRVTQFVEKAPRGQAPSNLINAGVYVLEPEIFDYIPGGRPVSIEHEVFPKLAKEGKLFGHEFRDVWVDIGKPADYLRANRVLLNAGLKNRVLGKDDSIEEKVEFNEPVMVAVGVKVRQNSRIGPYVVIGKDVALGSNVLLEDSVVFSGVTISDNASVRGSVIGEGTVIGKGAKIMEGCVIGDYVTVQDNVTVSRDVTICHSKTVTENVPESTRIT